MSMKLYFSVLFVLVLILASAGYSEPGTIMLDFDETGDVVTEPGFTSFLMSDSGTEIGGITIDLAGDIDDARRPTPNTDEGIELYTEQVYRDFVYGVSPSGITITLSGLGVNQECDITIYAFDGESEPNRIADWTANGDYLLTTDFIGLDAFRWPSPWFYPVDDPYEDTGTATADEFGTIVLESTRNPGSPEGETFAFVNALVVAPQGTYVPVPYAHQPQPLERAEDAPIDVNLEWEKGAYADTHDVYFGTDFNDVNDANRSNPLDVLASQGQTTATYDPPEFLELNKTYYWRIDEVNDPDIWKGKVWNFRTLPYFVMEDFDSYENDTALRSVWENGGSSAEVSVETDIAVDGNSMKYVYNNNLSPYYSEVSADIADLGIDDSDWLGTGATALMLHFYGDPNNPIVEKMYVKLTDGDASPHTATVTYGNTGDVRLQQWQEWNIALTEFADVNLANVAGITIGFGDGSAGSTGTVYFDDISTTTLFVSPTSVRVAAEANSTGTFTITSNTSWTVSNSDYWLTVVPLSGSNNETVTVTARQNGSLLRAADVTVSTAGDYASQTVTVTQGGPGGGGCSTPPIPSFSSLPTNPYHPDTFEYAAGTCMTEAEWACRRAEIAELIQEFELGYMQETPYSATTGSFNSTYNMITVDVNDNGHQISFSYMITYPSTGSPPYPAMIGVGGISIGAAAIRDLGVATMNLSTSTSQFYSMYGSDHSAGPLMVGAWNLARLIDALEKTPEANIDPTRLGVTGCSRNGKGALVCGAFNPRVALTIPQESGAGGAASWRVMQTETCESMSGVIGLNLFRDDFGRFVTAVDNLPFDNHMLASLCAPNALLFVENTTHNWLCPRSCWTTANIAHKTWEAMGIPDRMGMSQVGGHDHCMFPSSQRPHVDAYIEKFMVGTGTADTNIMYTDGSFVYDEARWVDWTILPPRIELTLPNPIKGDLNHDCGCGSSDLGLFLEQWLYDDCLYNGWCYEADLDYDGDVDFMDYAELAANWLEGEE